MQEKQPRFTRYAHWLLFLIDKTLNKSTYFADGIKKEAGKKLPDRLSNFLQDIAFS